MIHVIKKPGFTYLPFRFRFSSARGKALHGISFKGVVNEDGVLLDDALLRYEDIYEIFQEQNRLVFILYKGLAVSKTITQYILKDNNCLIVSVSRGGLFEIKSAIDQRYTFLKAEKLQKQLHLEDKEKHFRVTNCPSCQATIDLTYKPETQYTYCKHCDTIFNRFKHVLAYAEQYTICPETGFFDRVQNYSISNFYFLGEKGGSQARFKNVYCSDAYAEIEIDKHFWKNVLFLIALPSNLVSLFRLKNGRQPLLKEISKANQLALQYRHIPKTSNKKQSFLGLRDKIPLLDKLLSGGKVAQSDNIKKAIELYDLMIIREEYPPLFFNCGRANLLKAQQMLKSSDEYIQGLAPEYFAEAAKMFKKSLELCFNYLPTIELMEQLGDLQVERPEEEKNRFLS